MKTALKVVNLKKIFGGVQALDRCTLEIPEGKITAIIGPNGSGKTTLFNVISNLIAKDGGDIFLSGKKLVDEPDFMIAKKGISRTFQKVRLFKNLSIKEHMEIALSDSDEWLWRSVFGKEIDNSDKINESLHSVGLKKPSETIADELSFGQRKLLDLAIAITRPHKILMLDEPVAGVNPELVKKIGDVLKGLNKSGETIVVIEHDMNFVMGIADFVYVLDKGRVIASGKPSIIRRNKKVLEAYLGE